MQTARGCLDSSSSLDLIYSKNIIIFLLRNRCKPAKKYFASVGREGLKVEEWQGGW